MINSGLTIFFAFCFLLTNYGISAQITIDNGCTSYNSATSTLNQINKCSDNIGDYNSPDRTFQNRLDFLGPSASWKNRYRSLVVGAKVNGNGNFVLINEIATSVNAFNSYEVGTVLGCDVDGDCIYEREDEFLEWVQDNQFDEIIVNGFERMLQHGDEIAVSANPVQSIPNTMGELQKFEWHLARFIYKAKNDYNLKVVANLNRNPDIADLDKFYEYHIDYSRSQYSEIVADISESFFAYYENLWLSAPDSVDYIQYGQDTLFFPMDSLGRISDVDKFVTDIYNFAVYRFRVNTNRIQQSESNCTDLPIETGACLMAIDAHIIEWEWWTEEDRLDQKYGFYDLLGFLENLQIRAGEYWFNCKQEFYIYQGDFGDESFWHSFRANSLDSLADRVYLYAYHKNPCDCFNGTSSSLGNKFYYRANLFANNNQGRQNGKTMILPVFNAKFYDSTKFEQPKPFYHTDLSRGCDDDTSNTATSIDIGNCDYCQDYSGRALNDLTNAGYSPRYGYVENIFQDQYDLSGFSSDNIIHGYAWFKYSVMVDNGFISSVENPELPLKNLDLIVHPVPSEDIVNISIRKHDFKEGLRYQVFDLQGKLVLEGKLMNHMQTINVSHIKGVYLLQVISDESIHLGSKKIIVL